MEATHTQSTVLRKACSSFLYPVGQFRLKKKKTLLLQLGLQCQEGLSCRVGRGKINLGPRRRQRKGTVYPLNSHQTSQSAESYHPQPSTVLPTTCFFPKADAAGVMEADAARREKCDRNMGLQQVCPIPCAQHPGCLQQMLVVWLFSVPSPHLYNILRHDLI